MVMFRIPRETKERLRQAGINRRLTIQNVPKGFHNAPNLKASDLKKLKIDYVCVPYGYNWMRLITEEAYEHIMKAQGES
jgi:hypothetical protein